MTERQWQRQVERIATSARWLWYHTHDSRRSPEGFPDLVLVRAPRLVFAELKRDGEYTKHGGPQQRWLTELAACREHGITLPEVYVWRPADLDDVKRVLGLRSL